MPPEQLSPPPDNPGVIKILLRKAASIEQSRYPSEPMATQSDTKAEDESKEYENAGRKAELVKRDLKNKQLHQDIEQRRIYAKRLFCLICVWLVAVGLLLVANMFPWPMWGIEWGLSDPVLLALIGGTTANVLGLFYIVLKYLFPNQSS